MLTGQRPVPLRHRKTAKNQRTIIRDRETLPVQFQCKSNSTKPGEKRTAQLFSFSVSPLFVFHSKNGNWRVVLHFRVLNIRREGRRI